MKEIKTFLIGFLSCACLLLIMGQTMSNDQVAQIKQMANQMKNAGLMPEPFGKYQGFKGADSKWEYLIDTRNGAMWYSDGDVWVQQIKEVLPE